MSDRNKKFIESIKQELDELILRETVKKGPLALRLDSSWTISENSKILVDEFFDNDFLPWFLQPGQRLLKRDDKLKQFYCFLANLKLAFPIRPLRLSLHTNEYTKSPFFSTFIIDLFHWLEHEKYLFVRRGYSPANGSIGIQTRISPTAKFRERILEKIQIFNHSHEFGNEDLIILRNSAKENIPFQDTHEIIDLRMRLEKINSVNGKQHIVFSFQNATGFISTRLHAVFNNSSFTNNGRLYTGGLGYQILPKVFRKTIMIDGQKTVERDYSAHHPRILYALKLINYVDNPYQIVFPNSDDEMIKILKLVFLVLINAKNHRDAVGGCYTRFDSMPHIFPLLETQNLRTMDLISACKSAHKDIEDCFGTNQGSRLSNIDSKIALQVVEHFTSQGKACLPVHDSFIVKVEDDQELVNTMREVYKKVMQKSTNSDMDFTCIIK